MKILEAFQVGTRSRKFMHFIGAKATNFKLPEGDFKYSQCLSEDEFNELAEDAPNSPELVEAIGTRSIKINGVLFYKERM